MSWQGQMSTIVRTLVNDIDESNYAYSQERVEQSILASAQLMQMSVDFTNDYTINIETCVLTPDPTTADYKDDAFVTLVCLKTACMILQGEIRTKADCSISIKSGPDSVDYRDVAKVLQALYKDVCSKYEQALLDYKAGTSNAGQSVLSPYSPGSDYIQQRTIDHRSGGYFNY